MVENYRSICNDVDLEQSVHVFEPIRLNIVKLLIGLLQYLHEIRLFHQLNCMKENIRFGIATFTVKLTLFYQLCSELETHSKMVLGYHNWGLANNLQHDIVQYQTLNIQFPIHNLCRQ